MKNTSRNLRKKQRNRFMINIVNFVAVKIFKLLYMIFETYLEQKNINAEEFLWESPALFTKLKTIFNLMSEESFTVQKKFLINKLRRQFQLKQF